MVLDRFATLASLEPDPSSLVNLAKQEYDAYKSTTMVQSLIGDAVRKDFIIDQLEHCEGRFESFDTALKPTKKQQIPIDDTGKLKVLASSNDITQLLHSLKNAISAGHFKDVEDLLGKYTSSSIQKAHQTVGLGVFASPKFDFG